MVARRELQFTPDSLRTRQQMIVPGAEPVAYNKAARLSSASGIPSPLTPQSSTFSTVFADRVPDAVQQKQRLQVEQRYKARGVEALLVIAVSTALSTAAVMALARLIPYQTAQSARLEEMSAEVQAVEKRVEALRNKFPQVFSSGKSRDAQIRQYGFVKPNQIPIKILDSASPGNTTSNNP
jgi:cell division protein FtsB